MTTRKPASSGKNRSDVVAQLAGVDDAGTSARRWNLPAIGRAWFAVVGVTVGLTGCSTPGPMHLYSVQPHATAIHDTAITTDAIEDVPAFLLPHESITGFGYDPFTDHFFLRLAPGNHIRVVDRPARKIKRDFFIHELPGGSTGDVAVSPRDGHLFLIDSKNPAVFVATRLGEYLRTLSLEGQTAPAVGVAFDMDRNELLLLQADRRTIRRYDLQGHPVGTTVLAVPVRASLAYDSEQHEIVAPLPGRDAAGVFDESGKEIRTQPLRPQDELIDVGPHSFFRMF
jgi:hypothetical protein